MIPVASDEPRENGSPCLILNLFIRAHHVWYMQLQSNLQTVDTFKSYSKGETLSATRNGLDAHNEMFQKLSADDENVTFPFRHMRKY